MTFTYVERREYDAPASVLVEERRRVNIATVCNHTEECLRLIRASGECCCHDEGLYTEEGV